MQTHPTISIILPTFNVAHKVAGSLRSALEMQAPFTAVEVLIIDGASSDGTIQIVREWAARDPRIKLWSEPDKGIYDAMNKGIARAQGQMLYFMGAGDKLRAGVLAELEKLPNLHPHLLLYGRIWFEGANAEYGATMMPLTRIDLARRNIPHQGAFYGRGVFETVGLYDNQYRIYADHELNWRCWTNPAIETRVWDYMVADFEAGGASSSCYDPAFKRDWPRLVWRGGGLMAWASFKISERFKPEQLVWLRRLRTFIRRKV